MISKRVGPLADFRAAVSAGTALGAEPPEGPGGGHAGRRVVVPGEDRGECGDRGRRRRAHLADRVGRPGPGRDVGVFEFRDERREGLLDLAKPATARAPEWPAGGCIAGARRPTRSGPAAPSFAPSGLNWDNARAARNGVLLSAWVSRSRGARASKTSRSSPPPITFSAWAAWSRKAAWSSLSKSFRVGRNCLSAGAVGLHVGAELAEELERLEPRVQVGVRQHLDQEPGPPGSAPAAGTGRIIETAWNRSSGPPSLSISTSTGIAAFAASGPSRLRTCAAWVRVLIVGVAQHLDQLGDRLLRPRA